MLLELNHIPQELNNMVLVLTSVDLNKLLQLLLPHLPSLLVLLVVLLLLEPLIYPLVLNY